MLTGRFTPSSAAQQLYARATHHAASTPVTVRFSNSTGLPQIPDSSPDANPRGLAIRFHLAEHVHTDIVSHSVDAFPARDGYEFLEFLKAAAASGPDVPSPKPIEQFLGSHPAALRFRAGPQAVSRQPGAADLLRRHRIAFTNAAGANKFGRYRIVPEQGNNSSRRRRCQPSRPTTITTSFSPVSPRLRPVQDPGAGRRARRRHRRRHRALAREP